MESGDGMGLNEVLTALMDKVREKTGTSEKISLVQLITLIDKIGLATNPNLLTQTTWIVNPDRSWPAWSFVKLSDLNPGTYTFSWQANTSGTNRKVRIRIFNQSRNVTIPADDVGKEFLLSSARNSFTFTVPDGYTGFGLYVYGSGANIAQTAPVQFYNAKLESGSVATPF